MSLLPRMERGRAMPFCPTLALTSSTHVAFRLQVSKTSFFRRDQFTCSQQFLNLTVLMKSMRILFLNSD